MADDTRNWYYHDVNKKDDKYNTEGVPYNKYSFANTLNNMADFGGRWDEVSKAMGIPGDSNEEAREKELLERANEAATYWYNNVKNIPSVYKHDPDAFSQYMRQHGNDPLIPGTDKTTASKMTLGNYVDTLRLIHPNWDINSMGIPYHNRSWGDRVADTLEKISPDLGPSVSGTLGNGWLDVSAITGGVMGARGAYKGITGLLNKDNQRMQRLVNTLIAEYPNNIEGNELNGIKLKVKTQNKLVNNLISHNDELARWLGIQVTENGTVVPAYTPLYGRMPVRGKGLEVESGNYSPNNLDRTAKQPMGTARKIIEMGQKPSKGYAKNPNPVTVTGPWYKKIKPVLDAGLTGLKNSMFRKNI